jgi:hypothetical protein
MSHAPFNLSPDLKRLRDEGYFVQIKGGFLVMRDVPYVNAERQVKMGTLISSLNLAGDVTQKPDTHIVYFDGDYPCHADGTRLSQIFHSSRNFNLGHGITAQHDFSSKPDAGYSDYYEKMTTYAAIIGGPATTLKPDASARTFRTPEDGDDDVFNYIDTASDRANIGALSERLANEKIAIIGLGGSGAYILDFVAKTPVREIRLYDGDEFLQHNAFRAPGAPSIDQLREVPTKVEYLKNIYAKMHRGITATPTFLTHDNLQLLDGITFAFVSSDAGDLKRLIVEKLEALNVAFIDVGMGLELDEGSLGGILRTTTSTPEKRAHLQNLVSFTGGGKDDLYSSNIQVADLNALNAVLAVIKWKKLRGFYRDLEQEHHCTYTTDGNMLLNGEKA